jgi:glycosyltransferase involved in cell wall biosynthesis
MSRALVQVDLRRATWHPKVGLARYSRNLVRELLEIDPPDFEIVALDLERGTSAPASRTIAVGSGHHFFQRMVQEQVTMRRLSRRAELLHLPWYEGPARPLCPLVLTVHDLDTLDRPEGYSLRFRAYYNALLRTLVPIAKAIIVPSQATLAEVEARWPGRPYSCVLQGVDAVFSPEGPRDEAGGPTVLYTGGYGARKRVVDLLEAVAAAALAHPGLRLVLTGAPDPETLVAIERLGLGAQVELAGRVSDERLAELYRSATVVAYPSLLEGFGFPVVEAFASGTPVVAYESGSIPEVAGGAALLVPPGDGAGLADALRSLLDDAGLRERLTAKGLERARDFTWRATAEGTLAAYRGALAA